MSELIDQIAKLEAKAHALKESVSPLNIQSLILRLEEIPGGLEEIRRAA